MSFSSPTSRAQRSRRFLPWLLYLYALVLFAMHFVRIFDNSFWGDEGFSIGLAQMNVFEMLQVTAADNHPPLYYLFIQLLYHLLGNHGYVYHLSALIPYGLILILACTVIFRQFGLIPAVVVSTFASLTDTAIMFNVEARMYSLGAFFVLAAYLALHNILHSGKTSDWVIFSVASLCAAYTHYYALISVAFFYLALLSLLPQDKSSFKKSLSLIVPQWSSTFPGFWYCFPLSNVLRQTGGPPSFLLRSIVSDSSSILLGQSSFSVLHSFFISQHRPNRPLNGSSPLIRSGF